MPDRSTGQPYQERLPVPALSAHVRRVWYQRAPSTGQRVVPDGCADVLWRDGRLRVAGPDTGWRIAELPPGSFIVGVRFRPGAARLVFGTTPVSEVRDQEVDLAELWGGWPVREVTERAAAAGSPRGVAEVLERAIAARLPLDGELDPVVGDVASELDTPVPPRVPAIADRYGLSERQLRRRFVTAVGYGPKTLYGVLRLRRAMRLLERAHPRAMEAAVMAGYADQPHLCREMRKLAGVTPAALAGAGGGRVR